MRDKLLFTMLMAALGATVTGLLGNFAYGIIAGAIVGGGIDIYRFRRRKK